MQVVMAGSLIALLLLLAAQFGAVTASPVSAAKPANSNCWGVVTSQRAVAARDIGEHASSQDEPRLGLGNVARALLGEDAHVSDLGTLLAGLDDLQATACP